MTATRESVSMWTGNPPDARGMLRLLAHSTGKSFSQDGGGHLDGRKSGCQRWKRAPGNARRNSNEAVSRNGDPISDRQCNFFRVRVRCAHLPNHLAALAVHHFRHQCRSRNGRRQWFHPGARARQPDGGRLSRIRRLHLLVVFAAIELAIGLFGALSLHLFDWVGARTLQLSTTATAAATLALTVLPTVLMGATLPILTQYIVRRGRNVGQSVGLLYCVNTLGSALACFVSAAWLMGAMGMQGAVNVAAAINLFVGLAALFARLSRGVPGCFPADGFRTRRECKRTIARAPSKLHGRAAGCGAARLRSLVLRDLVVSQLPDCPQSGPGFRADLGCVSGRCRRRLLPDAGVFRTRTDATHLLSMLCIIILLSGGIGFLVLPVAAQLATGGIGPLVLGMLTIVFVQTAVAGAAFPLLCHMGNRRR